MLAVVVGLVILTTAGAAGFFVWSSRSAAAQQSQEHDESGAIEHATAGIVPLDSFVVNLADREVPRFLRITLRLVIDDKERAERISRDDVAIARLRSAILDVLSGQTSDRVVTFEGKTELRKKIAELGSDILRETKVADVLFTDFVVQF